MGKEEKRYSCPPIILVEGTEEVREYFHIKTHLEGFEFLNCASMGEIGQIWSQNCLNLDQRSKNHSITRQKIACVHQNDYLWVDKFDLTV